MTALPSVTCVIPTRNRPALVLRAVRSALTQSLPPAEVIVVVDGPDQATAEALRTMSDPRLRVIEHPAPRGPAEARNTGVRAASGTWVALLDDDDYWLPHKLLLQMERAERSSQAHPIISCRVVAETARGAYVWPLRLPDGRSLGSYLIARDRPFGRPGYVATPTLLVRRDTLLRLPFPSLDDHEDWAWLLEAEARFGSRVEMVEAALCVVQVAENAPSRSKRNTWRASLNWADRYRRHIGPGPYAEFIATKVAGKARRQGEWSAFPRLLAAAFRGGRPTVVHLVLFAGTWLLPGWVHRLVQAASFADSHRASPQTRGQNP